MMSTKSAAGIQIHPLSVARILWKHKLSAGVLWLTITAIGMVVVQLVPARYRAEALILVDSQKIPERYVTSTVNSDLSDRLATIRQQILSTTQLKKIIDDFDLYRDQRKSLVQEEILELMRKDIDIVLERGWTSNRPGAFRVAYMGTTPTTVAEVANRVANQFIEENLRTREVQAEGTSEFIKNELNDAKKKLDELELAVSRYKLQHNGELPQQEQMLMSALARLQIELQGNQDAINRAQQNKVILENSLSMAQASEAGIVAARDAAVKAAEGAASSAQNSQVARAQKPRKRSEMLQEQLDLLRVRYSDDHPDIKRMREDIERVKASEANSTETAEGDAAPPAPGENKSTPQRASAPVPTLTPEATAELRRVREQISTVKAQIRLNNQELETRAAEHKQILSNITMYQKRVDTVPVREQEMAGILRDYEMSKANYRSLLEKKQAAEMSSEMEHRQKSERFAMIDPARVPERPFSPNRILLRFLSLFVGLALALVVSVARELPQGPLLGEWELPADLVVMARVPSINHETAEQPESAGGGSRLRRLRLALVSSAVLAVLVVGAYLAWGRI